MFRLGVASLLLASLPCVALAQGTCSSIPEADSNFPRCATLSEGKFYVYWKLDATNTNIQFRMVAKDHSSWMSVAVSQSGGMKGGDFMVVRPDASGAVAEDRYSADYALPELDDKQHVKLISYSNSNGVAIAVVERPVDSCDPLDAAVRTDGPTGFLWALGSGSTFSYHGSTRGSLMVDVLEAVAAYVPPSDVLTVTLTMKDLEMVTEGIPDPANPYDCWVFDLQEYMGDAWNDEYHIVRLGPELAPDTKDMVHHMLLFGCEEAPSYTGRSSEKGTCQGMSTVCMDMIGGWAVGAEDLVYPPVAGMPLSKTRYLFMQMHYYNPTLAKAKDNSGFQLDLTRQLRKYNVGSLWTGQIVMHAPLPAYFDGQIGADVCLPGCFEKGWHENVSEVTVIETNHHMHTTGTRMRIDVLRDGKWAGNMFNQNFYDFQHQGGHKSELTTLKKTDTLVTQCSYDASKKDRPTMFADGTTDEMCIGILLYYPAQSVGVCQGSGQRGKHRMVGYDVAKDPSAADVATCVSECNKLMDTEPYTTAQNLIWCNTCAEDSTVTEDVCGTMRRRGFCPAACLNCAAGAVGKECAPNCTLADIEALRATEPFTASWNAECTAECLNGGTVSEVTSSCSAKLGWTSNEFAVAGRRPADVWPAKTETWAKCSTSGVAPVVAEAPTPPTCVKHDECGSGEYCVNGALGLQDLFSGATSSNFCSACQHCRNRVNAVGPNGETDRLYSCPCSCGCEASSRMCQRGQASATDPWTKTAFCPTTKSCVAPSECGAEGVCPSPGLDEYSGSCIPCRDWDAFLALMASHGATMGGISIEDCPSGKLLCQVPQLPGAPPGFTPKTLCPVTCEACTPDLAVEHPTTGCPGQIIPVPTAEPGPNAAATTALPLSGAGHDLPAAVLLGFILLLPVACTSRA